MGWEGRRSASDGGGGWVQCLGLRFEGLRGVIEGLYKVQKVSFRRVPAFASPIPGLIQ